MSKRGTVKIATIILLLLVVVLVSCKPTVPAGERPSETVAALRQVQQGTQGVQLQILPNYPPPTIYDQDEFVAIAEIKNVGAYDLEPGACFVQVTGLDPNIIRGGLHLPRSCGENIGVLEGKSVYNLEGSFNQLEFRSSSVYLPEGVNEYSPTLNFMTCYNYHTKASPSVCVDPAFYQITSEQKVCKPQPPAVGGGQGGPVAVTHVGVEMIGQRVIFDITIQNVGQGRVLSPYSDIQSCSRITDYQDLDRVAYNVRLSGGTLIDCKPRDRIVRLTNNQGKIVCSFNVAGSSAFETPLLIDLDYNYIQSHTKKIHIIKTPQ